jgi:serine/threonine protein kinase
MLEMSKDDRTPWSGFEKMTIFAVIYAISTATTPPAIPSYLSPVCQDFISRCLKLDPFERATIAELLLHPFFTTAFEDEDGETGLMQDESCDKATEESIMRLDRSGPQRTAEDIDSPPLRGGDASPIRGQELAKPTQQNDESHYLMQFSLRSTGSNYDEDFTKKPSTNPLKKGKLAGGEGGLGSSLSSSPKLGSAGDGTPMNDLNSHGSPLLAVPVDGIPTLVPRGERDPLLNMRREGSEPVIYHSSGGGRIGAGAIGGSAGAESSTQLALVEYVAHSQRNRKKKGFFAKLADKFRCVSL